MGKQKKVSQGAKDSKNAKRPFPPKAGKNKPGAGSRKGKGKASRG